jgi:hypothetical protein
MSVVIFFYFFSEVYNGGSRRGQKPHKGHILNLELHYAWYYMEYIYKYRPCLVPKSEKFSVL